jgi:hypothetical protein
VESRRWNQVESPGGITWNCRDSTDFTVAMRLVQPIPPKKVAMRLVKAAKWVMRLICPKWRHMWTDPAMPPPQGYRMELRVATVPAHLRLPHLAVVCCECLACILLLWKGSASICAISSVWSGAHHTTYCSRGGYVSAM